MNELDLLDLLQKLESGKGGRRTGELKRRGWLTWEVTDKGKRALANRPDTLKCAKCGHQWNSHTDKCHVLIDQDEYCDCREFQGSEGPS